MASYLALDIGDKRIGVALADVSAPFPAPLVTLEASEHLATEFANILKKHQVQTVVIGLPRNQSGERTAQTDRVEQIAGLLNIPETVPVFWQDESLTSVKAEAELKKRKKPYAKAAVDSLAATYILEDFLQSAAASAPKAENKPDPAKKKPKTKKKRRLLKAAMILFGICVAVIIAAVSWYLYALTPLTKADNYAVMSVKSGSGTQQIADALEQKNLIRSGLAFSLYVRLNGINNLQAGDYRLSSKQSTSEIAQTIAGGKVTSVNVLISPGLRLDQIFAKLETAGYAQADLEAAAIAVRDHPLLKSLPTDAKLEGYLFPETYKVGPDTSAEQLFRLMLDTFQARITTEITQGIAKQGLTLNQAVILASIVQKEVSDPSVQPTVAQVFLKRYREGISLGSDVTSLYGAVNDGIKLPSNTAQAGAIAVNHDSPYNTRRRTGLPPTAISNFNLDALKAVALPSSTDYLFFVAGDDGKTYFSRTSAEHEALVNQHCIKNC